MDPRANIYTTYNDDNGRGSLSRLQKELVKARKLGVDEELIPIPQKQLEAVVMMSHEQRLEWYDKQRKLRNKRKAARRKAKGS